MSLLVGQDGDLPHVESSTGDVHGRRLDDRSRTSADDRAGAISGHHHPVFRCHGNCGSVFPGGPRSNRLAGVFVRMRPAATSSRPPLPREWLAGSLRCLVSTGDDVLDFGPLTSLRRRLRHQHLADLQPDASAMRAASLRCPTSLRRSSDDSWPARAHRASRSSRPARGGSAHAAGRPEGSPWST